MWAYITQAELSSECARLLLADLRQGMCDGVSVPCFQCGRLAGLKPYVQRADKMDAYGRATARSKPKPWQDRVAEDVALCIQHRMLNGRADYFPHDNYRPGIHLYDYSRGRDLTQG